MITRTPSRKTFCCCIVLSNIGKMIGWFPLRGRTVAAAPKTDESKRGFSSGESASPAVAALAVVLLGSSAWGEPAPVGSIVELLDLNTVSQVKPWRTYQTSSGLVDSNFDHGNFVRVDPGRRFVLLDVKGKGCIDRFHCTYKKGHPRDTNYDLLVYLDGGEQAVIHMDLNDFFTGRRAPFVAPLAGRCGYTDLPASFSHVPVGFRTSCQVVIVPRDPEENYSWRDHADNKRRLLFFYQMTYRICEPEVPVKTFSWKLDDQERDALAGVKSMWENAGRSPWPPVQTTSDKTAAKTVKVGKAQDADLLDIAGPGTVREIHVKVKSDARVAARKALVEALWLEMTWDEAEHPQVRAPLGTFFAAPDSNQQIGGFWVGCRDQEYYCYLPMPFRKSARISVHTTCAAPANTEIHAKFRWSAARPKPNHGLFHACRYDVPQSEANQNPLMLEARGRGHVVGLLSDHRCDCEDDDSWHVDGDAKPSIHGTGAEETYNFSWGLGDLQALPLHGMRVPFAPPSLRGKRSDLNACAYRFHPAGYPFKKSLRLEWVREHKEPCGRYSGLVYYYMLPEN